MPSLTCGETGFSRSLRDSSVFSRHKMDCGEVSDFVHKILLVDERRILEMRISPASCTSWKTSWSHIVTPLQKKIRSFLGMVLYYQHFSLFKLLSEQRTGGKTQRSQVKHSADNWTSGCQDAFDTLKCNLSHSLTLAHAFSVLSLAVYREGEFVLYHGMIEAAIVMCS